MDSPDRRLISEGPLSRLRFCCVNEHTVMLRTQGHYFLFSDMFLFTRPTATAYDLKVQVALNQALYKGTTFIFLFLLFPFITKKYNL